MSVGGAGALSLLPFDTGGASFNVRSAPDVTITSPLPPPAVARARRSGISSPPPPRPAVARARRSDKNSAAVNAEASGVYAHRDFLLKGCIPLSSGRVRVMRSVIGAFLGAVACEYLPPGTFVTVYGGRLDGDKVMHLLPEEMKRYVISAGPWVWDGRERSKYFTAQGGVLNESDGTFPTDRMYCNAAGYSDGYALMFNDSRTEANANVEIVGTLRC